MKERFYQPEYFVKEGGYSFERSEKIHYYCVQRYFPEIIARRGEVLDVLDVGCACGGLLKSFPEKWGKYGVDISGFAIENAKTSLAMPDHFQQMNVDDGIALPDDKFDYVFLFDVIEHLNNPISVLKNIHRILKSGGQILLTTPNLRSLDRLLHSKTWSGVEDASHVLLYTPYALQFALMRAGFQIIQSFSPFYNWPRWIDDVLRRWHLGGTLWTLAKK